MRAIEQAMALERFEERMVRHMPTFSPVGAKAIGESGVREVVRIGIERGRLYGVTNTGLLRTFVELMFIFGSFFDTDPLHPWAAEALGDATIVDPLERVTLLHSKAMWALHTFAGPKRMFAVQALQALPCIQVSASSLDDPRLEQELVKAQFEINSRRAFILGEERLRSASRAAVSFAQQNSLGTVHGVSLVAFMMFTLGHQFAKDPRFPWVRAALASPASTSASERAIHLEQRVRTYIKEVCDYAEDRENHVRS